MTKPIFYTFEDSIWCLAPLYAAAELGYADDAIEYKQVNLIKGENWEPEFIKINPKTTLPTLVADGKVYDSTNAVTSYLISHAPNKAGNPSGTDLVAKLHEDSIDPNFALVSVRSDAEVAAKREGLPGLFINSRHAKLHELLPASPSEFKAFYEGKVPQIDFLAAVYAPGAPDAVKTPFFEKSTQLWADIATFLQMTLPSYLPENGFIGGDKPGEDDFHLAAWLSRIVLVAGGDQAKPEGIEVLEKIHPKLTNVHGKIVSYWELSVSRPSWQKVFGSS